MRPPSPPWPAARSRWFHKRDSVSLRGIGSVLAAKLVKNESVVTPYLGKRGCGPPTAQIDSSIIPAMGKPHRLFRGMSVATLSFLTNRAQKGTCLSALSQCSRQSAIKTCPLCHGIGRRPRRQPLSPVPNGGCKASSKAPANIPRPQWLVCYASPSSSPTVCTANATSQATPHCMSTTANIMRVPSSLRTAETAATHGV